MTIFHSSTLVVSVDDDDEICDKIDSVTNTSMQLNASSVIEGGIVEGWTPLSSVILWKRILGILGNVNDVRDAEIHACIFKHLIELWHMLETVSCKSVI